MMRISVVGRGGEEGLSLKDAEEKSRQSLKELCDAQVPGALSEVAPEN